MSSIQKLSSTSSSLLRNWSGHGQTILAVTLWLYLLAADHSMIPGITLTALKQTLLKKPLKSSRIRKKRKKSRKSLNQTRMNKYKHSKIRLKILFLNLKVKLQRSKLTLRIFKKNQKIVLTSAAQMVPMKIRWTEQTLFLLKDASLGILLTATPNSSEIRWGTCLSKVTKRQWLSIFLKWLTRSKALIPTWRS